MGCRCENHGFKKMVFNHFFGGLTTFLHIACCLENHGFRYKKKRLIFFLDRNSHVMNLNNEGEKHVSISAANAATVLSPVGTPTPSTVTPPVAAETAGAVIETNVNEVTIPSSSNQTQNDNEPSSQIIQEDSNKVNYWP